MSDSAIPASAAAGSSRDSSAVPFLERPVVIFSAQCLFILAIFMVWELVSGRLISTFFIGAPSRIASILFDWLSTGFLWRHVAYTMTEAVVGFLIGAAAGIALGLVLGLSRHLYDLFDPFLSAFYSIPKIALAPLLIIWFGLGITSKIVLAALIVFFLVLNATIAGLRNVDHELIDQIRIMGGGRKEALQKVILPSVALRVLNGLRLSFPYALHGAIVGELISSTVGLGYLVEYSRSRFDTSMMFASLFILMFVAVAIVAVIDALERYIPKPD